MIVLPDVLKIHTILIEEFGGVNGIRDIGLLESAINRPYGTFDNRDLYPTAVEKAAAILESVLINHPFVDGNKRTGYVLMRLILLDSNLDVDADLDDKYKLVIAASKGELRYQDIKTWLDARLRQRNKP